MSDFRTGASHIYVFIENERGRYDGEFNNRFAFSLGQAARYYDFLQLILVRYHAAVAAHLEIATNFNKAIAAAVARGSHPMTDDEMEVLHASSQAGAVVELEIETYYLFAKIFHDRIAHFLQYYFGQVKGCTLRSHTMLLRHSSRYFGSLGLALPKHLLAQITHLDEAITTYRDKQVAHHAGLRTVRGTSIRSTSEAVMFATQLYPNEHDTQVESRTLGELCGMLDAYSFNVLELIVANRARSRLPLVGPA